MLVQKLKDMLLSPFVPQARREGYYYGVSRRYGVARLVIIVVLVVFILASLIFGYREFTYENIYYFFKDLDTVLSSDSYTAQSINYGSGEKRGYTAFKGGIAVADKYSVSVYSSTGRRTAEFNVGYFQPQLRVSDKYLLIYESGGASFCVCNSFTRLYSETLATDIYAADISALGEVLVHTYDSQYRAVLYLYDSGFQRAAAYYIRDYVTSAAVSADGKYVVAATVSAEGGEYISELRAYRRNSTEPIVICSVRGELAMKCGAFSGGFYLLTDRGVRIMDTSGEELLRLELPGERSMILCDTGDRCLAVISRDGAGYYMSYVPFGGQSVTVKLDAEPLALDVYKKEVYVLFDGVAVRYDFDAGKMELSECVPGASGMVTTADRRVLVCYSTRAVYSEFREVTK